MVQNMTGLPETTEMSLASNWEKFDWSKPNYLIILKSMQRSVQKGPSEHKVGYYH